MPTLSPKEKEILFLYNKHNKNTKFPLEIEEIDFPQYIIKILEKSSKRTKIEAKKLATYRNKVLYDLKLKSWDLEYLEEEKRAQKRKENQLKIAKNKDIKYQNDPTKIKHFGIWFDNNENAKISRESYAKIDKKVHNNPPSFILDFYDKNPTVRADTYDDEKCTIYSDKWCMVHRDDCIKNFELNMSYFARLDKEKFDKALLSLLKKENRIKEIFDINECDSLWGIYILVLDHYKQIYIGQSKNIKKRILQHWRAKKEFDRLIFGGIETSILSIDVFGCLDTTRIFVLETWNLDDSERTLVDAINNGYLLNRTAGGIKGNDRFAALEILANRNERNL